MCVQGRKSNIYTVTVISNHAATTMLTGGKLGCYWVGPRVGFAHRFGGDPKVTKCIMSSVQNEPGVWMQGDYDSLGPQQERFVGKFQSKASNQSTFNSKSADLVRDMWTKYEYAWNVRNDPNQFPAALGRVKAAALLLTDGPTGRGYIDGLSGRRKGDPARPKKN